MTKPHDEDSGCDHEDADLDMLTGRVVCSCGFTKWLSNAEFVKEQEFRAKAEALYEAYLATIPHE